MCDLVLKLALKFYFKSQFLFFIQCHLEWQVIISIRQSPCRVNCSVDDTVEVFELLKLFCSFKHSVLNFINILFGVSAVDHLLIDL